VCDVYPQKARWAADEAARLSLPEANGLPEFHFGTITKLYKKFL